MGHAHQGDVGTPFRLALFDGLDPIEIDTATVIELVFRTPSSKVFVRPGVATTGNVTLHNLVAPHNVAYYESRVGDLLEWGNWRVQARVVVEGRAFHSDVLEFVVDPNIPGPFFWNLGVQLGLAPGTPLVTQS